MAKCKECKKVLSIYNKGRCCFACNRGCIERDEKLIKEAKRTIAVANNALRFLTNPKRIARDILKNQNIIKRQEKLIDKIKEYVVSVVDDDPEDDIEI